MKRHFRSNIQNMDGYVPGFQPKEPGFIKLNTNENPYPPSPAVLKVFHETGGLQARLYPDPLSDALRDRISGIFQVPRGWVIVGNGSDDVLNLIVRATVGKGDKIFITDPTYILYKVLAGFQESKVLQCKLDQNFDLPEKLDFRNAKLIMLSNPNTPTGMLFQKSQIIEICQKAKGLVVIDEAYADFAQENCMDLVKKIKNVVVTRSFSKSFSMAGIRLGFAIARPDVVETLMKVKDSYNVNRISQMAGLAALNDLDWMKKNVQRVIRDRDLLSQRLTTLGFKVLPSQANFIFAQHVRYPAERLYEELYKRKILVRHFKGPRLKNYLRISIGTHRETVILIKTVEQILREDTL